MKKNPEFNFSAKLDSITEGLRNKMKLGLTGLIYYGKKLDSFPEWVLNIFRSVHVRKRGPK